VSHVTQIIKYSQLKINLSHLIFDRRWSGAVRR